MTKGIGKSKAALELAKHIASLPREDCTTCGGKDSVIVGSRTKGCTKCDYCEHWVMEEDLPAMGVRISKMKNDGIKGLKIVRNFMNILGIIVLGFICILPFHMVAVGSSLILIGMMCVSQIATMRITVLEMKNIQEKEKK